MSVIIPHLNQFDDLRRCLDSIMARPLDHGSIEIVVVDNGSRPGLDAVRDAYPAVQFLAEARPGPGLARNRGADHASAARLAFVDADCFVDPGWLQAAVEAIEADPARGVVGGDIRIPLRRPGHADGVEAYESVFSFRQKMYIETRNFSVTANLAMARAVYDAVGPFRGIDVAEDRDWGARAAALGYTVRYQPGMVVFHPARADFPALTRKWARLISHDFTEWCADGHSLGKWYARAAMIFASTGVHAARMFTSDRVSGIPSRIAGLGVLVRLRAFRFGEMIRVARNPEAGVLAWNRNP
ncbi:MAG: glycosyltransferase family 2 protein [Janthinobacterium lividum]